MSWYATWWIFFISPKLSYFLHLSPILSPFPTFPHRHPKFQQTTPHMNIEPQTHQTPQYDPNYSHITHTTPNYNNAICNNINIGGTQHPTIGAYAGTGNVILI